MPKGGNHRGLFMENGSGGKIHLRAMDIPFTDHCLTGFVSQLSFIGGKVGFVAGKCCPTKLAYSQVQ
jgi:hypothetical protein